MPSATFLVHVTVPDVSPMALASEADDISHDLTQSGHDVVSVAPWTRPTEPTMGQVGNSALNIGASPAFDPPLPPVQ